MPSHLIQPDRSVQISYPTIRSDLEKNKHKFERLYRYHRVGAELVLYLSVDDSLRSLSWFYLPTPKNVEKRMITHELSYPP